MILGDRVSWLGIIILSVLFCGTIYYVGAYVQQSDFYSLMTYMTLAVGCMAILVWLKPNDKEVYFLIGVGIFIRWILMWYAPLLSDDLYRFLWDGHLWQDGINPFSATPSMLIEGGNLSDWYTQQYDKLNSQDYFTIYPPVCQGVFWLSTLDILPFWLWGGLLIKMTFFIAECMTIWSIIKLCRHFRVPLVQSLFYILNPLILIELMGNLHFETLMVCFITLMLLFLVKAKYWQSGLCYGLAVCTKILPLMFGPFLLLYLGWKKSLTYFGVAGLVVIGSFSWMLQGHLAEILSSINLYFQTFEFNASLYYIGRGIGQLLKGYNVINTLGPLLSIVGLSGILWLSYHYYQSKSVDKSRQIDQEFILAMMSIFTVYLLTATTVHPWYLSMLVLLSVFTQVRYAIVWSWVVLLSYSAYLVDPTTELLWLVGIEYIVVITYFIMQDSRREYYVSILSKLKKLRR